MTIYRRSEQRIHWGEDALRNLLPELRRLGVSRPLVICGASVQRHADLLDRVSAALGAASAGVFAGTRSHSPLASVEEASAALDEHRADSVIAVGGGSALVTARAACILHAERRPVAELATSLTVEGKTLSPRLLRPKLPIIAVPTTPTTAICKAGAAVTTSHEGRLALFDPKTRSKAILLDPHFLSSSPPALARDAGLNALVMAVEGLATGRSHVFSDALLVHAIQRLTGLLPDLAQDRADPQRRVDAALASIMVGDATDTTGGGLTAALSHTIGHHHAAANGIVDAILLPHVFTALPPAREPAALIAGALDCSPVQTPTRLSAMFGAIGVPTRLRDIGTDRDDLDNLAAEATADFAYRGRTPRPDVSVLRDILHVAW
jgi:alcohol dehydrogenase class IV